MNTVEPIRDINKIKEMRSILRSQSIRNELLFILGINVGIRISDILKLKTSDILKTDGSIKEYVVIKEKKTEKTKKFYIGEVVANIINEYYSNSKENLNQESFIFVSRKGENKPITRQQAYRIINSAAQQINLDEIGTHTMRKTFGYHAYQNKVSLELLMQIFNHSTKSQTLRYIGITEEEKKNVYLKSELG